MANPDCRLTKAQESALRWLYDHGGDGLWCSNSLLLAGGREGPYYRSTWNSLRGAGLVESYNPRQDGRGRGRLRLTVAGRVRAERIPTRDYTIDDELAEERNSLR